MPGLHRHLSKCKAPWASLFNGMKEQSAFPVAPFLVLAGVNGEVMLSRFLGDWIGEKGSLTSSIIALSSPHPFETMAQGLADRLEVKLTQDMDAMLRFFDPRVLESLSEVLNEEQRYLFFSIADEWLYIDRIGRLKVLPTALAQVEKSPYSLSLDGAQESSLIRNSEIDQVMSLLRSTLPISMGRLSVKDRFDFVSSVLGRARKDGLTSVMDLATYAAILLSKGEGFADTPSWRRFIKEWSPTTESFSDFASSRLFDESCDFSG